MRVLHKMLRLSQGQCCHAGLSFSVQICVLFTLFCLVSHQVLIFTLLCVFADDNVWQLSMNGL